MKEQMFKELYNLEMDYWTYADEYDSFETIEEADAYLGEVKYQVHEIQKEMNQLTAKIEHELGDNWYKEYETWCKDYRNC